MTFHNDHEKKNLEFTIVTKQKALSKDSHAFSVHFSINIVYKYTNLI